MTDILSRVRALLTLAGHPNTPETEAANAALAAAKIIRQENYQIVERARLRKVVSGGPGKCFSCKCYYQRGEIVLCLPGHFGFLHNIPLCQEFWHDYGKKP